MLIALNKFFNKLKSAFSFKSKPKPTNNLIEVTMFEPTQPATNRYHLNNQTRRFLKSMGWGKIPPRSCHPELYHTIMHLKSLPLNKCDKRAKFKALLGN